MKSSITPGNTGISALTNADRPMVGQSEYVVNAGLGYGSASGAWAATLLYNVAGKRILEAGSGGLPDAYEQAASSAGCVAADPYDPGAHHQARRQEPAGLALSTHPGRRAADAVSEWQGVRGHHVVAALRSGLTGL